MFYLYVVIFFLWTAIALYLLLGGADFGAGIVEFFSKKKNKKRIRGIMYESMGPVWEANHMWLIIVIVILFVGFPTIYAIISTYLHIPLMLMLIGIIGRGTAFAFRNYDVIKDDWHKLYDAVFKYSSILTPFFLGVIAAATISGSINVNENDFVTAYIKSWFTPFGCMLGFFTVTICGYLASSYTLAQVREQESIVLLKKKVNFFLLSSVLMGGLVFFAAHISNVPLINWVFGNLFGLIAVLLATLAVLGVCYSLKIKKYGQVRVFAGFQILMILFAVTYPHYPNLLLLSGNEYISLTDSVNSEPETIKFLAWALILGSIFILPGAFHLIYVFQKHKVKH